MITVMYLVQCESLEPVDMICEFWVLLTELWYEECLLVLGDATHHICINYALHPNKSKADHLAEWIDIEETKYPV
jgi:hypothetical protein